MNYVKEYFLDVLKNHYFDFAGRANRKQFWIYALINFIIIIVLGIVGIIIHSNILTIIYSLAVLLPGLGIGARRLRDGGFTPWLLLIGLIPFIGWIALVILYIMPSK